MTIVSLTFRGNEPFYLGGWRREDGVYTFEAAPVDGRELILRATPGVKRWHWSVSEQALVLFAAQEKTLAQAKISALLQARRIIYPTEHGSNEQ